MVDDYKLCSAMWRLVLYCNEMYVLQRLQSKDSTAYQNTFPRWIQQLARVQWLRVLTFLPGDVILNAGYFLRYISLLYAYLYFLRTCSPT